MPDLSSSLTRRIGPLPAWAWGGLVAVGFWWFFVRGKGAKTSSAAGATQPGPNSIYGLGYAQGLQAAAPGAPTPTAAQPPGKIHIRPRKPQGQYDWPSGPPIFIDVKRGADPSNIAAYTPFEGDVPVLGQPVQGGSIAGQTTYYPVSLPGGATGYVSAADVAGVGGVGGPHRTARKHAIGANSKAPWWHEAHPQIGQRVLYPHYVRAVGGPRAHHAEVRRVAAQAGVHPARVAMLNPTYTGRIRVA